MANVDDPRGLRPVRYLDGSPYNGAVQRCAIIAAVADDMLIGTPVKLAAAGGATFTGYDNPNMNGSFPGVDQADTTEVVFGVITAFEPNRDSLGSMVHDTSAWSTDRQVMV
ncbi:unnamed protein product, partial [marine sediment metagenome]